MDSRPHALLAPEVVVMNTDDDGPGSLRQAIVDAADGSVIHFDAAIAGQTIVLTTGHIVIVKSTGQVTLLNSTMSGNVGHSGGGILSGGSVTIWNSTVVDNVSQFDGGIVTFGNLYLSSHVPPRTARPRGASR